MMSRNVTSRCALRALSLVAALGGVVSMAATARGAVSATIVPGTLVQGTVKASLAGGSYANEANRLDDWPLNTGGGASLTYPVTLTNSDFNGNSFGGTPNTMVAFGAGGGVTLRFTSPIHPVEGQKEFGIFTAQMLLASSGALFNGNMEAAILVSADNVTWRTLAGDVVASPATYTAVSYTLNAPTLAYNYGTLQRAWSYGSGTSAANLAALSLADYETPMPDDSLFNNPASTDAQRKALSTNASATDYAAIFGTSGGGNWFDLSSAGLAEVNFVRLNAVNTPASGGIRLDAIYASSASVPEPGAFGLAVLAGVAVAVRRR